MDQREFNKELSSYLRDRKESSSGLLTRLKRRLPTIEFVGHEEEPEPEPPLEVPKEHVEAVLRGEDVPPARTQTEQVMEEEFPKKGFFRGWFESLFPSTGKAEYDEWSEGDLSDAPVVEEAPATVRPASQDRIDADVKEMLRTCVRWVNLLPPEQIQEIRRSEEYHEFKRLLDKYGLLKK